MHPTDGDSLVPSANMYAAGWKILRRGSFRSIAELETKVVAFVTYFNEKLAHPYRFHLWKAAMEA